MRRVVQQVHCAHWGGTHRLEGGFGFCACHRPPRRQTLREFGGAVRGRGSAWTAAACRRCGRWARVEPGPPSTKLEGRVPPRPLARVEPSPPPNRNHRPGGVTRPSKGMLSPRVEAGTLRARAARGPLRARNGGPAGWSICGRTRSGGTIGVRNGGNEGLGRGAVDASCWEDPCPFQRTGRREETLWGLATFSAQRAPAPVVQAQPPHQRVQ